MCHSVTFTESSCKQVQPFPVMEILHCPTCISARQITEIQPLITNPKQRLALYVGVPLLAIETNVKDPPPCYFVIW